MKKIVIIILPQLFCLVAKAQIINESHLEISKEQQVDFNQSFTNKGIFANLGDIDFTEDLDNESEESDWGNVSFTGEKMQTISGTKAVNLQSMVLNNDLNLLNSLKINSKLTFNKGILSTKREAILEFGQNANYKGAKNTSHVDGTIRKLGSENFEFPLGDGSQLKTFQINNHSNLWIEAQYIGKNPSQLSNDTQTDLIDLNQEEYWQIKVDKPDNKLNVEMPQKDLSFLKNGLWTLDPQIAESTRWFTTFKGKNIERNSLKVWPNPTTSEFNIQLASLTNESLIDFSLIDEGGNVLFRNAQTLYDLQKTQKFPSQFREGIYILRLEQNNKTYSQKIILKK